MFSRIPRVAGVVAGALLVSGAAVVVTAHAAGIGVNPLAAGSPAPSASPRAGAAKAGLAANCQAFVGYFANDLGTTPAKVNSSFQDALGKTLADAVKSGQITQAQADKIKSSAANRQLCRGIAGVHPPKGGPAAGGKLGVAMTDVMNAVAKAAGVSPETLKSDFKGGQTVQQIATANHVDEQAFESSVVASLTTDLDSALSAGQITQQQHDAMVKRLPQMAKAFWNGKPGLGAGRRPAATPSPGATS